VSSVIASGEKLNRAIRWLSDERTAHPERPSFSLVEEAVFRFDLTPAEEEWMLATFVRSGPRGSEGP
jgi:hypothetical protein